ncbi:thioredoxin [Archangium violaceum]|uniref:thioredoxin n=1 Tax=Archangium TaxID=47 RepID=UPI000935861D|nr:thioredoxin [Archangium sp. Cb G35]OJT27256.1 thioredoxin [Archangium sp. Cb G35]WPB79549.1 thioredoxin [Archangium gephyra]
MSDKIIHVSEDTFEAAVLKHEGPILVDFWADWCGPCSRLAPILDELAEDYAGRVTIAKLNIEENRTTARAQGVERIPVMMLYKQGERVALKEGVPSKAQLGEFLSAHL